MELKLTKILAKKDGVVFGKTEDGNVVFKQEGGEVITTGWFESLEDGWYLNTNIKAGNEFEFFGGSVDDVVSHFAEAV